VGEVHHDYFHFLVVPLSKHNITLFFPLLIQWFTSWFKSLYVPKHYLYCNYYDCDLPFVGHKGSITISLLQSVDCIIAHHLGHLDPLIGAHCLHACNYLGFDVVFIVASTMLQDLFSFFIIVVLSLLLL
jgi:hypothetical protein